MNLEKIAPRLVETVNVTELTPVIAPFSLILDEYLSQRDRIVRIREERKKLAAERFMDLFLTPSNPFFKTSEMNRLIDEFQKLVRELDYYTDSEFVKARNKLDSFFSDTIRP